MTKICTDVEQSNKLIELGIDVNTADMCYHFIEINKTPLCIRWEKVHDDEKDNSLPAWSLAALLGIIPFGQVNRMTNSNKWEASSWKNSNFVSEYYVEGFDTPIDACVAMIEKLHEFKLLLL